jgi:plastocyanin
MSTQHRNHFTTRRAFVATAGFGVVSLYLLWAGYGAAPLGLGGHEETAPEPEGGHGGVHGAAAGGPSVDEFRRLTQAFVEQHRQSDGSVKPGRVATAQPPEMEDHGAHGADAMSGHAIPESTPSPAVEMREAPRKPEGGPIEVYLMAYQWGYSPSVLRLEAGVPYRFRMMAVDVAHGASIQLGRGGRIVRLRPNVLVEQELTFTQAGEYLLYCTVYCGLPHDRMQGRIIVTPAGSQS